MFAGFLFLLLLTETWMNEFSLDSNESLINNLEGSATQSETWLNEHTPGPNETLIIDQLMPIDDRAASNDGRSSGRNCSDLNVYNHLKSKGKMNSPTRPVLNYKEGIEVKVDVLIYAILDVKEKDQEFFSYVWVDMIWIDEYIRWEPNEFCGISRIHLPAKMLWRPDLTIEEMTERDKAAHSPYLSVSSNGRVLQRNDMLVVSTCRMNVYQFPFDSQSCELSFKSILYDETELYLTQYSSSKLTTLMSSEKMRSLSGWEFVNTVITNKTVWNFGITQSMLVVTINIKRMPLLYVVNFMLPILFFLGLDFSSFMISESGGEKLSFKVTVLLAVTVLQLILNEILPSSSERIPLIAVYCIGIFGLMMLSLLETILVMYLMEKDSIENEPNKDQSPREDCRDKKCKVSLNDCLTGVNKWIHSACVCNIGDAGATSSELLSEAKEGSSSQLMEESHGCEKLSEELREVVKALSLLLNAKKEDAKPGYWTRMTKIINKVFFVLYIITASAFLFYMFVSWTAVECRKKGGCCTNCHS